MGRGIGDMSDSGSDQGGKGSRMDLEKKMKVE